MSFPPQEPIGSSQLPSDDLIRVFISYDSSDEQFREKLETHLSVLVRQRQIVIWHQGKLEAGSESAIAIHTHLARADVILLLVSAEYLASGQCYTEEMGRAIERHQTGHVQIIPILVRPSDWKSTPIGSLSPLPSDKQAISRSGDEDEAMHTVAQGIKQVVQRLQSSRKLRVSSSSSCSSPSLQLELEQNLQVKLIDNTLLELVYIPPGFFYMGSPPNEVGRYDDEGPQHRVKVPGFYMGKYPITQAQWYAISLLDEVERTLDPKPSNFNGVGKVSQNGNHRPIDQVSWLDAVEFCNRLSIYNGQLYRLPSEAEWEYACRAQTSSRYAFGDDITWEQVNCFIWKTKMADGILGIGQREIIEEYPRCATTDVGAFEPNAFGLYDMHGNVREWCLDHWNYGYDGAPSDGSAWIEGGNSEQRVNRGGSWRSKPNLCRSAYRCHSFPETQDSNLGFRVVLVP